MKFKNKHILDIKKRSKITSIIGIAMIIISLVFFYLSSVQDEKDNENTKYLNDIIGNSDNKTGLKSYLNISWLSDKFAVRDDMTDAFYYAYDGNYYYIVFLSEKKAKELLNMDLKSSPTKIEGITSSIPNDVKEIVIDDYNSALKDIPLGEGEERLTKENFYKFFGSVYLDQTQSTSTTSNIYLVVGILTFLTGFITTIVGLISSISISSRLRKISDVDVQMLEKEMSSSESFYYDKAKVYLTPNYIIMVDGRLLYYKYSDILWMYSYEHRYNGMRTVKAIKILTKDAKTSMFANLPLVTKTQKEIYDEIWNTIASKNPNIKLGYSSENVKYFKGVIKDIKNEKKTGTIF